MTKRAHTDLFAQAIIRREDDAIVRAWLTKIFKEPDIVGRARVLNELVQKARREKDSVSIVRAVVVRGNLLLELDMVKKGMMRNPNSLLYRSFHGVSPKGTRRVKVPRAEGRLIAIGRIVRIEYEPYGSSKRKGIHYYHIMGDDGRKIHREKPILATSEDGKSFFIVKDQAKTHFTSRGIIK